MLKFDLISWLLLLGTTGAEDDVSNWMVNRAKTSIDISTPVVTVKHSFNLTAYEPASWFYFALDNAAAQGLSRISARAEGNQLMIENVREKLWEQEQAAWKIHFQGKKTNVLVAIDLVLTSSLLPLPAKIKQDEQQYLVYSGNLNLYTPYKVSLQHMTVKLEKDAEILSYTKASCHRKDDKISCGPFHDLAPFTVAPFEVHFANNVPLLVAHKIQREIVVSHWGQISVRDFVQLENQGAALSGEFSRLKKTLNAITSFTTFLPAAAKDIYYRDEIGTISSYQVRPSEDAVVVKVTPRFPLAGGWKTSYELGYNVPAYEYLRHDGENFELEIPTLDSVFQHMVVEELVLKVTLPEGSQLTDIHVPEGMVKLDEERVYSLLDTDGRQVYKFAQRNVVDASIRSLQVSYKAPLIEMIRKPFVLASSLSLIFFGFIAVKRMALYLD